jgi:hypothetical protein
MTIKNNENIHVEQNFVFSDVATLLNELKQTTRQEQKTSSHAEIDSETQRILSEELEVLLRNANNFEGNKKGRPVSVTSGGKYNIQVHKFCWAAIKTGYTVITFLAGQGQQTLPIEKVLSNLAEFYAAMGKTNPLEWLIIDIIQTWTFRNAGRVLVAPGPTLQEIEDELGANNAQIPGGLQSHLEKMIEKDILRSFVNEDTQYYQAKYLSEYLH